MTTIAAARAKEAPRTSVGKIALASLVGTTIEFYDFYIFGTAAALVFGPMFFPKSAPEMQTLNAYLTFGLAFLARPQARSRRGRSPLCVSCRVLGLVANGAGRR